MVTFRKTKRSLVQNDSDKIVHTFVYKQYLTFYETLKTHEQLRAKVTNSTARRFSVRRMVDRDKFCFQNKGSVKVCVRAYQQYRLPPVTSPAGRYAAHPAANEQRSTTTNSPTFNTFNMPLVINIFLLYYLVKVLVKCVEKLTQDSIVSLMCSELCNPIYVTSVYFTETVSFFSGKFVFCSLTS